MSSPDAMSHAALRAAFVAVLHAHTARFGAADTCRLAKELLNEIDFPPPEKAAPPDVPLKPTFSILSSGSEIKRAWADFSESEEDS